MRIEHHRSSHHGSRQRPPPGLVDARYQLVVH
jgi:hypothetical protein